jgi:hypothetical protein
VYILSCCSTADISAKHYKKRNISYISFHYELGGVWHDDDIADEKQLPDFYRAMSEGVMTRTSQVNFNEFIDYFESMLQSEKDVLHICLSSGISGVYNSAVLAAEELREKYPQRKIFVADSLTASSGCGLLMDKLADLRDSGMSIEEVYNWVLENRLYLHAWFFSTDLTYYIRGGRISKTAGFIGSVLNICPLLNIDAQGKLIPRHKIRGKKKVIYTIAQKMFEFADKGINYSDKCYISHSDCIEDAKEVAGLIQEKCPNLKEPVLINNIGTTIGSHTGPGTVALFFWGSQRQ